MQITVYGTGYVGLVAATGFAKIGHNVLAMDVDAEKINRIIAGDMPFYEPNLASLVKDLHKAGKLTFTTCPKQAVTFGEMQVIAVGTPSGPTGEACLKAVDKVALNIAKYLVKFALIVNKSTVPVGTAKRLEEIISQNLLNKNATFSVASNPEFLREGSALDDFLNPDRVVIGVNNPKAEKYLKQAYQPIIQDKDNLIVLDRESSELAKYAANCFLATKISFINEIANLADKLGADINQVTKAMSLDHRIGPHFLKAGCGFGGSCFGKDIRAIKNTAAKVKQEVAVLEAVYNVNLRQRQALISRILNYYSNNINGKKFAVLGLSYKPNTDDLREAPSIEVISYLLSENAHIKAYDPKANQNASKILPSHPNLSYANSATQALDGQDAVIICTEWQEFINLDLKLAKQLLKYPVIFDGRNIFDLTKIAQLKFNYFGIGRKILSFSNKVENNELSKA